MSAMRIGLLLAVVLLAGACATDEGSVRDLTFLTRDGCVNTPMMRANLDGALTTLGLPTDYAVIDSDTLAASDARVGYPTPTVLYHGRDLFGMREPPAPPPPAS